MPNELRRKRGKIPGTFLCSHIISEEEYHPAEKKIYNRRLDFFSSATGEYGCACSGKDDVL